VTFEPRKLWGTCQCGWCRGGRTSRCYTSGSSRGFFVQAVVAGVEALPRDGHGCRASRARRGTAKRGLAGAGEGAGPVGGGQEVPKKRGAGRGVQLPPPGFARSFQPAECIEDRRPTSALAGSINWPCVFAIHRQASGKLGPNLRPCSRTEGRGGDDRRRFSGGKKKKKKKKKRKKKLAALLETAGGVEGSGALMHLPHPRGRATTPGGLSEGLWEKNSRTSPRIRQRRPLGARRAWPGSRTGPGLRFSSRTGASRQSSRGTSRSRASTVRTMRRKARSVSVSPAAPGRRDLLRPRRFPPFLGRTSVQRGRSTIRGAHSATL